MSSILDLVSGPLGPHAVRIPTRKRQRLSLATEPDEMLYLIRQGVHLSYVPIPNGRHQVLSVLHPGDIVRSLAMPPLEGAGIIAASEQGEVWRLRWSAVSAVLESDPALVRTISDRLAEQTARGALHATILAGLTGEERVAALMFEFALRTGREAAAGLVFEMPLSRNDIAEHMALNVDTVSRIVSRMREKRLIVPTSRRYFTCPCLTELGRACPLASTIKRAHLANRLPPK